MSFIRKSFILLFVSLGVPLYCYAQGVGFDEAALTTFIESQMRASHVPGLAVGIVQRDRIVYLRGFGTTKGQRITPQSPFLIGSLSKSFTALGVMQLVEAGKLNLDAPVHTYLPWFRLKDPAASRTITVRHLLNQTSGLPTSAGFFTPDADSLSRTDLAHPVGRVYEYSNLNYRILGMLVEAVTGKTYAAYIQEHLLEPLQMHSTYLTYDDAVRGGLVGGHQYIFGLPVSASTPRYDDGSVAAGYIASSAQDMCHYLSANLQDGVYEGHRVISPAGLALMYQPQDEIGSRYSMGWVAGEWSGLKSIWHTGLNENFSANMNILPEKGYGIIILGNVNSFTVHNDLMDGIIRQLHGQPTKSYVPYELLQRLLLLIILLFGLAHLLRQLLAWRGLGYPFLIKIRTKVIVHLAIGIAISCVLLIAVAVYAGSPLNALLMYQPDVGYGVICGAVIFTLAGIIGAFVRSKLSLTAAT
jgi:CubicO group peptidase (beta-lactamase class C family)